MTGVQTCALPICSVDQVKREPPPQIITEWRTYDCGDPPTRDPIKLKPIEWKILDGRYTLAPEQYAVLGENMGEILKASGQMVAVIRFYRGCIEAGNRDD